MEFFKGLYEILGQDLLAVVDESKRNKMILPAFNSTFTALIPKDSPSSFEDFRSISLCNVVYKVITKIIANRIKSILFTHISKSLGFCMVDKFMKQLE